MSLLGLKRRRTVLAREGEVSRSGKSSVSLRRLTALMLGIAFANPTPVTAQDFFGVLGNALKAIDGAGVTLAPTGFFSSEALDVGPNGLQAWGFYVLSSQLSSAIGIETMTGFRAENGISDFTTGLRILPSVTTRLKSWQVGIRPCGDGRYCPTNLFIGVRGGIPSLSGARATLVSGADERRLTAHASGVMAGPTFGIEFPLGISRTPIGAFLEVSPQYVNLASVDWRDGTTSVTPPTGWPVAISGVVGTVRLGLAVSTPRSRTPTSPTNPTIATASPLPVATQGAPYRFQFAARGGDERYVWRLDGPAPPGLQLTSNGVLEGTPSSAGTYPLDLTVVSASRTAQKGVTLTVNAGSPPPPIINTTMLPVGEVGTPYRAALVASGGDGVYTWALDSSSPTLPSNLVLGTDGVIQGTPIGSAHVELVFEVTSATIARTKPVILAVRNPNQPIPPRVTTTTLPDARVDQEYSASLAASGGGGGYEWSLTGSSPPLPAGLRLDPDGTISGKPTTTGTVRLEIAVTSGGLTNFGTVDLRVR